MTDIKPARWLNYPGDCSDVVGQVVGPELHGALMTIVAAQYDAATDQTRVGLVFGARTDVAGGAS